MKVAGPLLTAAGLVIGVLQYQHQQAHNDALEYRRVIWNKRLATYEELGAVAAQLVSALPDTARFDTLTTRFRELYWGKLPLLDDARVDTALKTFNDEVLDFKEGELDATQLKTKGFQLMKACQRSLHDSWKDEAH